MPVFEQKVAGVADVASPLPEFSFFERPSSPPCRKVADVAGGLPENAKFDDPGGRPAIIAEWRDAIANVKPDRPDIDKLKAVSLSFLDSADAITAVEHGWDALSLFGMHRGECYRIRIDCWGLVLFLAWGVHKCSVETIDAKVCALRTRSGAVQMLRPHRENFDQAIPWWQHPGIVSAPQSDTDIAPAINLHNQGLSPCAE